MQKRSLSNSAMVIINHPIELITRSIRCLERSWEETNLWPTWRGGIEPQQTSSTTAPRSFPYVWTVIFTLILLISFRFFGGGGQQHFQFNFGGGQQQHHHHQQHHQQQQQPQQEEKPPGEPFAGQTDVIRIGAKNFRESVERNLESSWILFFYKSEHRDEIGEMERASKQLQGFVRVGAVDVERELELATELGITSLPTALLFPYGDNHKKPQKFAGPFKVWGHCIMIDDPMPCHGMMHYQFWCFLIHFIKYLSSLFWKYSSWNQDEKSTWYFKFKLKIQYFSGERDCFRFHELDSKFGNKFNFGEFWIVSPRKSAQT